MLGKKVRDKFTGYEGVATARCEYAQGKTRVLIERVNDKGALTETWIDEDRLTVVE